MIPNINKREMYVETIESINVGVMKSKQKKIVFVNTPLPYSFVLKWRFSGNVEDGYMQNTPNHTDRREKGDFFLIKSPNSVERQRRKSRRNKETKKEILSPHCEREKLKMAMKNEKHLWFSI